MTKDERKKELLRAWRREEQTKLLESIPMAHPELRSLFDLLNREDAPACDHTLRETIAFLNERNLDVEKIVRWLNDHGGYCDCEVIFNVADKFGEIVEWHE